MRVSVTDRQRISERDLRSTVELAPTLALPWLIKLRYVMLGGEAIFVCVAAFVAHVPLLLLPLLALLAVTLVSNLFFRRLSHAIGARLAMGWILVADVVSLTVGLALVGAPANPFSLLYLVQITLSAVVLSKAWTRSLGGVSILGFGLLFFFHVPVPALEGHHLGASFTIHLVCMWISFVAAATLITVLVGKVSETLRNHELELLRLQNLLGRQEKITSLATLAAGAAHEMGTPLGTIAIASRELERYAVERNVDQHVAAEAKLIRSEVDRCGRILREMSSQGAEFTGETPTVVAIGTLLEQLRDSFPDRQRGSIRVQAAAELRVTLPAETTRQALAALVKNAIEASSAGQSVQLAGEAEQGVLRFIVKDSGAGMSPEVLHRIAEPFYTTKQAERGMGLGTFLVRTFAEDMGGALIFDSSVNQGTTAILELPLATATRE
jgi:two-component system sensor histidine kinase RegB